MTRHFGDSTFSAGDMWFVKDDDVRICCNGIVLNGALRGDILTVNGSRGLGRQPRSVVATPLVPPRNPRAQLPPR